MNWVRTLQSIFSLSFVAIFFVITLVLADTVSAQQPYLRTYGNDVVAGGGYGTGCSVDPDATVRGYGSFLPGAPTHQNYVGAGSELAVFSPGDPALNPIEEFLPGSVVAVTRQGVIGGLGQLSFANSAGTINPGSLQFGGGYNGPSSGFCADAFPEPFSAPGVLADNWVQLDLGSLANDSSDDTITVSPTANTILVNAGIATQAQREAIFCDYLDVAQIPSGINLYVASTFFHFGKGCSVPPGEANHRGDALNPTISRIPDAARITILVDEDPALGDAGLGSLSILSDVVYDNADTAAGWSSLADVPQLRVYVKGDLKIDYTVERISGLYYANKNSAAPGFTSRIWTCTVSSNLIVSVDPVPAAAPASSYPNTELSRCNRKLTVFGALVGDRIAFYRTNGDLATANASNVGESWNSGNLAEAIVFSPEVYLPLLQGASSPVINPTQIDSIRALPPAF